MGKAISLLLILLFIPLAFAVSLNDTVIQSVGLNTSIYVNETIYFDSLDINESYIYFNDLRTTSISTEGLTINITDEDERYYHNVTTKDLPYYSTSITSQKIITSGIENLYINITFNAECNSGTPNSDSLKSFTVTYPSGGTNTIDYHHFECNSNVITYHNLDLQPGNTILDLTYAGEGSTVANQFIVALTIFSTLIGIIILSFLGHFIFKLFSSEGEADFKQLIGVVIMVGATAIIVLIFIVILYLFSQSI